MLAEFRGNTVGAAGVSCSLPLDWPPCLKELFGHTTHSTADINFELASWPRDRRARAGLLERPRDGVSRGPFGGARV